MVHLKRKPIKEKFNPRKARESYLEKIENDLKKQGLVIFDEEYLSKDTEYLMLPPEITELPSKEIGEYLSAFTQHKIYLRTLLGRCELMLEEYKRRYFDVSDKHYREYSKNNKMSETSKEKLINGLEDVRPFYEEYTDFKNRVRIIGYEISNVEDAIFLLSREVTRRNADFANENREYNIAGR